MADGPAGMGADFLEAGLDGDLDDARLVGGLGNGLKQPLVFGMAQGGFFRLLAPGDVAQGADKFSFTTEKKFGDIKL